jgi:tetratricopeptide (TPR) repeat protein
MLIRVGEQPMSAVRNLEQAKDHIGRGMKLRMAHDLEGAIAEYNTAIELDPQNAEAYNNRGNVYTLLEDRRRAVADYTKAIDLDPNYAVAYYNRGLEKQFDGDIEGAMADYTTALSLQPQHPQLMANIHCNLGILYETTGDHEKGLANFDEAIRYNPRHVSAYYNRGLAHERNGNFTQAIADYRYVLQLATDHPQSRYMQGLISTVEYLQAELKTRLSRHTPDIDKALADIWPLLAKALEGVRLDAPTQDPYALLDHNTVESLLNQMLDANSPTDPASTEGQRAGNGD